MKKQFLIFGFAALAMAWTFTACQPAAQEGEAVEETTEETGEAMEASEEVSAWDQLMEDYHEVMAATFHPAEEGDIEPLKKEYAALAEKAKVWAEAEIPAKHAGKGLEQMMTDLVAGSEGIGKMVADGASDEDLTKAIVDLHEVFHGIIGACNDAGEHGMHQQHHEGEGHQHGQENKEGGSM